MSWYKIAPLDPSSWLDTPSLIKFLQVDSLLTQKIWWIHSQLFS